MAKQSAYFALDGALDAHTVKQVKKSLDRIPGVFSVSAGTGKCSVCVDFDNSGTDIGRIESVLRETVPTAQLDRTQEHIM